MLLVQFSLVFALVHRTIAEQPSAPSPIAAQLRELPWGQLNFLHTTDTHGWHGGHLQEPQYSADWGDYVSFAHHLRNRADADGSDLLTIDTGDRVEGNGLYDASQPPGKYTLDIVDKQHLDVVCVGNHELYQANTSIREYTKTVSRFKDSYIASNLDIYSPEDGKKTPFAPRFRKFTTKNQGIRIIAFGFLYNFKGNANNTFVQPVEEAVKEPWFADAVKDKQVDLFLVAGHAPVRNSPELEAVYKAIRANNWDTPIVFFGGHTHVRDYRKFEKKAWALESGRYMETLGFLSVSGLSTGKENVVLPEASVDYKRSYIDNNLFSLRHHSQKNESTFDTELGRNTSHAIALARKALKLDLAYGCAPQDYWLNRAPYPSESSLLSWLEKQVLPDTFRKTKTPSIVITNSGAIRFDILKGPFTIDSTFLVSPFKSGFKVLSGVPFRAASLVLQLLNNEGQIALGDLQALGEPIHVHELAPPPMPLSPMSIALGQGSNARAMSSGSGDKQTILAGTDFTGFAQIPGYTTVDDAGSDGDDTVHQPIQFYNVPNCIGTNVSFPASALASAHGTVNDQSVLEAADPEEVDLIYNEFIEPWVILALRYLGEKRDASDSSYVLHGQSLTNVIRDWIKDSPDWACPAHT